MKIRKLEEKDIDAVIELCREVREFHRVLLDGAYRELDVEKEKKALLKGLLDKEVYLLVAEEKNGGIVGYLLGRRTIVSYLVNPDVAVVDELGVGASFQKQGVGRMLLEAFLKWCKDENISEVRLGVYIKNEGAREFYEKCGFEPLELGLVRSV